MSSEKIETKIAAFLAATLLLAACAGSVEKPDPSGFLSDYSRLEMRENGKVNYIGDRVVEYEAFLIDPVTILYERDTENPVFSDEQIEDLKQYLVDELTEQLTKGDGYAVVSEPGPGVARIRIGITEIDRTIGALNVSTYTKLTGLGLGGVSTEGEVVDSVTDEQIAAAVRWGNGSRVTRAGYTATGDAKIAIGKWAKEIREALDQIHGR